MTEYHYIREGQPGSELFTFVVGAEDLLQFAKVERFNDSAEGVERKLNYHHVRKLADFMRQPNATLAEPILGDLRGDWQFEEGRQILHRNGEGCLLIDEGQHRLAALHLLNPEERARWQFKVTATRNTAYQERLRRFLQQLKRLKLDNQLVLQIEDRGDLFPDRLSKNAYQLVKQLAIDPDSPLRDIIRLEERHPRLQPTGEDAEKLRPLIGDVPPATVLREQTISTVPANWVIRDLRQVIASPHSLLRNHSLEHQYRALANIMTAARQVWPEEWNNVKDHYLRRGYGVAALMELFVVGRGFKDGISRTDRTSNARVTQTIVSSSVESFREVLGYAKDYDWSFKQYRRPGMKFPRAVDIALQLDALILQKMPKSFRKGRPSRKKPEGDPTTV